MLKKTYSISALVLIIAFLLPWFANPVFSVAGYDIGRLLHFVEAFRPIAGIVTILVYLIPLGAIFVIILSLLNRSTGTVAMLVGSLAIILFIVLFFRCRYILQQCRIGFFLNLAASLALLITGAANELLRAKFLERGRNNFLR